MPLVSVIIPVYNSEKFITEVIESVLNQTYKDFEIIVIDDGSTDNSIKLIESYQKREKNIKIIRQTNSGAGKARNQGIKAARGRYCAFLDSDDIMMPDKLKLQVKLIEEKSDVGLVYTDLMAFNEKGIVYSSKSKFISAYSGYVLDKLLIQNFITTSTVLANKECFNKAGYFDEKFKNSQDYKMWLNIARIYKISYLDLPLVKYRYTESSLSSDKRISGSASFNVVKQFWHENKEYKKENKILYRISVAKHLSKLGHAYYNYGQNKESLQYLIKALYYYPFIKVPYKLMVKIVIRLLKKGIFLINGIFRNHNSLK